MRTLHEQAAASRRTSLLVSPAQTAVSRPGPDIPNPKVPPRQFAQATGSTLVSALTAGFSAQCFVLLFCWLTDAIPGVAPSLLFSSLVGLTAFCLGLAFSKGSRGKLG